MINELVLATDNKGKILEIKTILAPTHCILQSDYHITTPDETGLSFIENAILKARHASTFSKKPALADDSGLVVPALHGAPGIYSARYANIDASDDDNIALLLKNLQEVSDDNRTAYFYCAIAVVMHAEDPTPIIATGRVDGEITKAKQGTLGFGYDPIFYLPKFHCTMAELPTKIKNTISHRAQALEQLRCAI